MKTSGNRDDFITEVNQMLRRMTISGMDECKHVLLLSVKPSDIDCISPLMTVMHAKHRIYRWEEAFYIILLSANKELSLSVARQCMEVLWEAFFGDIEMHAGITPVFMEDDQLQDIMRRVEQALYEAKKFKAGTMGYALENSVFVT